MTKTLRLSYIFLLVGLISAGLQAQQFEEIVSGAAIFTFNYTGDSEIPVNEDCLGVLDWGHPSTVTLNYDGPPGGEVTFFDINMIGGGYEIGDLVPAGETVRVEYKAEDNLGNEARFSFILTFVDEIDPEINLSTVPTSTLVYCINSLPDTAQISATDNCDPTGEHITYYVEDVGEVQACEEGLITRRYYAVDSSGNTDVAVQLIIIRPDTVAPEFTTFPDTGFIECGDIELNYQFWLNTQRNRIFATDIGCDDVVYNDNAPDPSDIGDTCGVLNILFTATDFCGNSDSTFTTYRINDTENPVIIEMPEDLTVDCSETDAIDQLDFWVDNNGNAEADDNCSEISWSTIPENIYNAIQCDTAIDVTFIASDRCGNTASASARLSILDNEAPSIFTQPNNELVACDNMDIEVRFTEYLNDFGRANINDICTPLSAIEQQYIIAEDTVSKLILLDSLNASFAQGCTDSIEFDGVIYNNIIADISFRFIYIDQCGNSVVSDSVFLAIRDTEGPELIQGGMDTIVPCIDSSFLVNEFNAWYENAAYAEFGDDCGGVQVSSVPGYADLIDSILNGNNDCNGNSGIEVEFNIEDLCGNPLNTTFKAEFAILDTVPPVVISSAMDTSYQCNDTIQDQLIRYIDLGGFSMVEDACNNNLGISFGWMDSNGNSGTGEAGSGPYPQLDTASCNYTINIDWFYSDGCGNEVMTSAEWHLIDTIAPSFENFKDTLYVSCDSIPGAEGLEIIDNCSVNLDISFEDTENRNGTPQDCSYYNYKIERIYTIEDACGSADSMSQIIFVQDTTAPSYTTPNDIIIDCSESPDTSLTGSVTDVVDGCGSPVNIKYNDMRTELSCGYELIRQWTVSDVCGNSATSSQLITVIDTMPPELNIDLTSFDTIIDCSLLENVELEFSDWIEEISEQFVPTDNCGIDTFFIANSGSYEIGDTSTYPDRLPVWQQQLQCKPGIIASQSIDIIAIDECGLVSIDSVSFSVYDTIAPVISGCPQDITLFPDNSTCLADYSFEDFSAQDECSDIDSLIWELRIEDDTIVTREIDTFNLSLMLGEYKVEILVKDCSNNLGECKFNLRVIDTIPPEVNCPADTVIYLDENSCSQQLNLPDVSVDEKCDTLTSYTYTVDGDTETDTLAYNFNESITLKAGTNVVTYFLEDISGNETICKFKIELRDTFPPVALCRDTTLKLNVSGNDTTFLTESILDNGSFDNCEIKNYRFNPEFITCNSLNDTVQITYIVEDFSGNNDTCLAEVYVEGEMFIPSYEIDFCSPDTLYLYSNLHSDTFPNQYTYEWTGPENFFSTFKNPVITDPQSTQSGEYQIIVTGAKGCSDTSYVDVVIEDFSQPLLISDKYIVCAGDNFILQSSSYSGSVTYQWYEGTPGNGSLIAETNNNELQLSRNTGQYNFYIIATKEECDSDPSEIIEIEVVEKPVIELETDTLFLCERDTLKLEVLNIDTSFNYQWSGPNNYSSNKAIPDPIAGVYPDFSGKYQVQAKRGGCRSEIKEVYVSVQASPETPHLPLNVIICDEDTLFIPGTSQADYDQYEWIHESGLTVITDTSNLNIIADIDLHSGSWKLRAKEGNCFSELSDSIEVIINPLPNTSIISNAPVCQDGILNLEGVDQTGATYEWSSPSGEIKQGRTVSYQAENGIYILTVTSEDFCIATDSVEVKTVEPVDILSIESDMVSCVNGDSDIQVWAQSDPIQDTSFAYFWYRDGNLISQEDTLELNEVDTSFNGNYELRIDIGNCMSEVEEFVLDFTQVPETPEITESTVFCSNDSMYFQVETDFTGAELFEWVIGEDTFLTNSREILIPPFISGDYSLILTAFNGNCASEGKDTLNFSVIDLPVIGNIDGDKNICSGDSLNLSIQDINNVEYVWEYPDGSLDTTDNDILIFPADTMNEGNYRVKILVGPCSTDFSEVTFVKVNQNPEIPIIEFVDDAICVDDDAVLKACIDQASATPGAQYQWLDANTGDKLGDPTGALCKNITELMSFEDGTNSLIVRAIVEECASVTSIPFNIELTVPPNEIADAGPSLSACETTIDQLDAVAPDNSIGRWIILTDETEINDPTDPKTQVNNLVPGPNILVWTLSYGACSDFSSDTTTIFYDIPPVAENDDYVIPFGGNTVLNVTDNDEVLGVADVNILNGPENGRIVENGDQLIYYPNNGFIGSDSLQYEVCSVSCPDKCSSAIVDITVGDESLCDIPTIFTPNGDGINDQFIIQCLSSESYDNNRLVIFNINGDEVFEASPYKNNWEGRFNGEPLPDGTYYYIVDFGDGSPKEQGFVVIER